MRLDNNHQAFFTLVKAGLFPVHGEGLMVNESLFHDVDWKKVYQLAQEQAVVGLAAAGIERFKNANVNLNLDPKLLFQIICEVQMIEQRNKAMNTFIAELIAKLRKHDIYALLVKGQGVAQCYEKPLWRTCGDVDLLLSSDNFEKASSFLNKYDGKAEQETSKNIERKHRDYQIDGWTVELHGTMHSNLSKDIDKHIDKVQRHVFYGGKVRVWQNVGTEVFLPNVDEDIIFVFTHILQHLFLEGIGLRQICDWCRLLWTYKDSLNQEFLESRIKAMGIMSEWKVFYNMANRYLGMPDLGAGILVYDSRFDKEADRLIEFVLEVGNFGHNREVKWNDSFNRRAMLIWHRITDTVKLLRVFPMDAPKFLLNYAWDGVRGVFALKQ